MKAIANKINQFTPVDDKGPISGTFYLDQFGNVVTFPEGIKPKQEYLPYAVSVNLDSLDDVVTMHVSEIEDMITKLKNNLPKVQDKDMQMKYQGYLEALNYVVSHNSYIDPWKDFIDNIEEDVAWYGLDCEVK